MGDSCVFDRKGGVTPLTHGSCSEWNRDFWFRFSAVSFIHESVAEAGFFGGI